MIKGFVVGEDGDTLRFEDVVVTEEDEDDGIAALERVVNVSKEGNDVVITRTDEKGGTIRIEGIAADKQFTSVQDLNEETLLVIIG